MRNLGILILLVGLITSKSFADIYQCEDLTTGEIFFTNLKNVFPDKHCRIYIKERPKKLVSKKPFYEYKINDKWFEEVGKNFSLDPALLKAIAKVESSFNPKAISPKGALGLMQLMPETAELVGVENPFDPLENLKGGALYLKKLLEEFGDLELALAAYNAGPEKVRTYGGIPPYPETQAYVKDVLYYYTLYRTSDTR